jgi:hypothetical protein
VIFTYYMDEADTHGPSPTVIMAGFLGHAYQWNQFEKKLARLQDREGFRIFHAKDFKARRNEFAGWSDEKCDRLVLDITKLTLKLTQGIATALTRERYLNEYRTSPIPKKLNLDSQYGVCFRSCLGHLLHLMQERGDRDRLHVVLERGHPNANDCERIFNDIKRRWARAGNHVLGGFALENKNDCMPLMVADFLAAATSLLRAGLNTGKIGPNDYKLPPTDKQLAYKGATTLVDLAPNALQNLKLAFEAERRQGAEEWRARKAAKMASSSIASGGLPS